MNATTQPRHTNRLIHATSPYLLQHAHNPVDWHPWGDEALATAREQEKPIFLSIGYAACHWCHVMERESFENEAVAAVLNEHFVSIKVDREERPDLDDIYMKATQILNRGGGGWPMSVFLTPDGRPFFAGTYFPPESRYGRPGFKDLLLSIARVWKDKRGEVDQQADALSDAVRQYASVEPAEGPLAADLLSRSVQTIARAFDPDRGGISGGGTNKFPPSMAMDLMLREHHRTAGSRYSASGATLAGDQATRPAATAPVAGGSQAAGADGLLQLVEVTLDHMARGGIYDQLAGGIARYSTDHDWLVPHFEKMLYDQALVSGIYLDGFAATGKPLYARIAGEILDYVIADLQSPQGGYYCTRDADSEGVEGRYYVWSKSEVAALLGADAELFCSYYDVSDAGNWEETNILHVPRSAETVAKLNGVGVDELERRLAAARRKLLERRATRVPPLLDDKVLASWNGLMIASMARAAKVLEQPKYLDSARRAAEFVLGKLRRGDGRLLRTYRAGKAHTLAYLDDHAFLIEGLLNLFEATGETGWLDAAVALNDDLSTYFEDAAGGYFFTPSDGERLLVRAKDASDGAIPSGNSVQLMNLLRLGVLLDDAQAAKKAERLLGCFAGAVQRSAFSSERMLAAYDFQQRRPREVALVIPPDRAGLAEMERALWRTYVPNKIVAILPLGTPQADGMAKRIPLLAGKTVMNGRTTAYVCRNFACQSPTSDPAELARQLAAVD